MSVQSTDSGASAKRKRISERRLIDGTGAVITDYAQAAGVRLTVLHLGKPVHTFDEILGEPGQLTTMAACFGLGTKIGNVINSVVNADDYDGHDPTADVKEWLDAAHNGQWREPGEGPRGPKYDPAVMAAAILATVGEAATTDVAGYQVRYQADKSYAAKVRAVPAVMATYWRLVGEAGPASGDIA